MKRTKLQSFILLLFIIVGSTACNEESLRPISLIDSDGTQWEEESQLTMTPFSTTKTFTIQGGDGKFIVNCEENEAIEAVYNGETITITPKAKGIATITINDKSGHTFTLQITVNYVEHNYTVTSSSLVIVGENITIKEEKELAEKVNTTFPINPGGGYRFIFTSPQNDKGEVLIYSDYLGGSTYKEGTFTIGQEKINEESTATARTYTINIDGKSAKLYMTYDFTRAATRLNSTPPRRYLMAEEVTERYKAEYPNVEKIYATQSISISYNY